MGEIRFVGTVETRGYPYLVCKKRKYRSRSSAQAKAILQDIVKEKEKR